MLKDIIIIGGGIIGCSIARELSKYNLSITLIDKNEDVATGVSKANSGIIHAGFNENPNTLKAKLCVEGNKLYDELSKELNFTFNRNGALVLAFNEEEEEKLIELKNNAEVLNISDITILNKEELIALEKNISTKATAALFAKNSGIINPFEATIALAENAFENGVEFLFNSKVININNSADFCNVTLENGQVIQGKIVINAAGLLSDEINNLINRRHYNHTAVKGEYYLLDKVAGKTVSKTIFTIPSKLSKGILVTPTADGNLLIGPTADEINDRTALNNTLSAMHKIKETASLSVENIPFNRTLNTFSGIRPNISSKDFIIELVDNNIISLVGIASPGLTAAPAIAKHVVELVNNTLTLTKKVNYKATREKVIKFTELSVDEKNALIKENPSYGKIVCKCELITEGEVINAISRPLGAKTLDGIKRRTRATMGGCQGIGCLLPVVTVLSKELGIPLIDINKNNNSSTIVGFKEDL